MPLQLSEWSASMRVLTSASFFRMATTREPAILLAALEEIAPPTAAPSSCVTPRVMKTLIKVINN
jgi:hypothetical protein